VPSRGICGQCCIAGRPCPLIPPLGPSGPSVGMTTVGSFAHPVRITGYRVGGRHSEFRTSNSEFWIVPMTFKQPFSLVLLNDSTL
jgi:hypothetical protein